MALLLGISMPNLQAQWNKISSLGAFTNWVRIAAVSNGDIWTARDTNNDLSIWHFHQDTLKQKLSNQAFSSFVYVRQLEDSTTFFQSRDTIGSAVRIYAFSGNAFANITPTGGPWTILTIPEPPSDSMLYIFATSQSTASASLFYTDRQSPWTQFFAASNYISLRSAWIDKDQGIYFSARFLVGTVAHEDLYYHDGVSVTELTPPDQPIGYWFCFSDNSQRHYFRSQYPVQPQIFNTLHFTNGQTQTDITPVADTLVRMQFYSKDDKEDLLMVTRKLDLAENIYRLDSNGLLTDITPIGTWSEIIPIYENPNGSDFVTFKNFTADSLHFQKWESNNLIDLTSSQYWNEIIYLSNCQENPLFKVKDGNTNLFGLWSSESGQFLQVLPSQYHSIEIHWRKDHQNQEFITTNSSDSAFIFICDGTALEDITPPGHWNYLEPISIQSDGVVYLHARLNDAASLFKYQSGQEHVDMSLPKPTHEYKPLFYEANLPYFVGLEGSFPDTATFFKIENGAKEFLHHFDTVANDFDDIFGTSPGNSFMIQGGDFTDLILILDQGKEAMVTPPIASSHAEIEEEPATGTDSTYYFQFYDSLDHVSLWIYDHAQRKSECSSNYLFLYDQIIPGDDYGAEIEIISEGQISNGASVNLQAPEGIILWPKFEVALGAEVQMTIGIPCPK